MTKKEATAAIAETNLYIRSHGGTEDPQRSGTDVAYEIQTNHGPAFVSVIAPWGRGDMPWIALRYSDMEKVHAAMDAGRLSRDVNPYSGKFNCHILNDGRTAKEIVDAFRQHLTRAGFPTRTKIEAPAANRGDEECPNLACRALWSRAMFAECPVCGTDARGLPFEGLSDY